MAFVSGPALPSARPARAASSACTVNMTAANDDAPVSRRAILAASLAAVTAVLLPKQSRAEREYDGVPFLGGGEQIDVNNANIRAYLVIPGFYPGLAGLIVQNGPYKSVDDLSNIPGLSDVQKDLLKQNKNKFVALDPVPEYVMDKINNGLYR